MPWKLIVVVILTVVYLYGLLLQVIRLRSARNPIPENVADVYDPETYAKWRAYHAEKGRLDIWRGMVAFAVELALILPDAYAAFAGLFPANPVTRIFAVLLLSAIGGLATLPFEYYDTMVIEEKYGFNRTDRKTFWADRVKELVISLGLLTGVGALLMLLHQALGDWLIVVFAGVMTLFLLLFSFLYPVFSRIFNKFTPLPEGELKDKLTALLEKNGYRVRAIQVMDASRRTAKVNAYFTGFGRMKTIVLYDTLLEALEPDEICAVFAHEMGHGLHRDTLKRQILSFVQMLTLGVLAWLILRAPGLFPAFGFGEINYGFALLLIMNAAFALVSPLFGLVSNWASRRAEYRADAQAVKEGYGPAQISCLKKIARLDFADLSPSPLLVKLEYSHPTLSQRIEAMEKALSM